MQSRSANCTSITVSFIFVSGPRFWSSYRVEVLDVENAYER